MLTKLMCFLADVLAHSISGIILNRTNGTSVTLTSEVHNSAMQYYSWKGIEKKKGGWVSSAVKISYWYTCHMCWFCKILVQRNTWIKIVTKLQMK
jgi:hypothetical protein